jgi:DNA-binding CsgD family transcriptional regulator
MLRHPPSPPVAGRNGRPRVEDDDALLSPTEWIDFANQHGLTICEVKVLGLVFRELTDKQIARKLNLGLETVHTYMTHLHQKLHVHSRVGLAVHATRWLLAGRAGTELSAVACWRGKPNRDWFKRRPRKRTRFRVPG